MRFKGTTLVVMTLLGASSTVSAQSEAPEVLACGGTLEGKNLTVTRSESKCAWPFDVTKMQIRCNGFAPRAGDVFFVSEKGSFALNGKARARFKDPLPIWLDQSEPGMGKIDVSPWIQVGLSLC